MSEFCLACTYAEEYAYHADDCRDGRAIDGAWSLGVLGFALAGPAAAARAIAILNAEAEDAYFYGDRADVLRKIAGAISTHGTCRLTENARYAAMSEAD